MNNSCTQMRHKRVSYGTLNISNGVTTTKGEKWVTEPCGVPLFGDRDRQRGKCQSCAMGWTHVDNYPVTP